MQKGPLAYVIDCFVVAVRRVYRSNWLGVFYRSAITLFAYMIIVSVVIDNTSTFRIIAD